MCCIPEITRRTEPIEWKSFDPALFFTIQQNLGMDPYVRGDVIGFESVNDVRAECLLCWARKADPNGKRRAEYAARRWRERQPHEIVVKLG